MKHLELQIGSEQPMRCLNNILGAALVFLIFGCSGSHVRMYAGEKLPPENISVIKSGPNGSNVKLMAIDSKTKKNRGFYGSSWDGAFNVELVPGPHTFVFAYENFGAISYADQSFAIDMKPGKTYLVDVTIKKESSGINLSKSWKIEILDAETHQPFSPQVEP
jgi:hypothetical protein